MTSVGSGARVDDLLNQAQRTAWDFATDSPADWRARSGGRGRPWETSWRGMAAAWPEFARGARHALESVPLAPGMRHDAVLVTHALQTLSQATVQAGPQGPDTRLQRMGQLLGAVGDLLENEHAAGGSAADRDGHAVQARILTIVETAAAGSAGIVRGSEDFAGLAERCRQASRVTAGERAGRYDDVLAPSAEPSLERAVRQWQSAAERVLSVRSEVLGVAAVRRIAVDAAALTQTAAAIFHGSAVRDDGPGAGMAAERLGEAGQAWRSAATAWPAVTAAMGRPAEEFLDASRALHAQIRDSYLTAGTMRFLDPAAMATRVGHLDDVRSARRVAAGLEGLGEQYATRVRGLLEAGGFLVPAKLVSRPARGHGAEHVRAVRTGRVVPLPAQDPIAVRLVETAVTARDASTVGAAAAAATAHRASFPVSPEYLREYPARSAHQSPAARPRRTRRGIER
ncbi:MAG: hypothetical protein WAW88_04025 [Nocardioides sp.]